MANSSMDYPAEGMPYDNNIPHDSVYGGYEGFYDGEGFGYITDYSDHGKYFYYRSFPFEKIVYLYIWEIMVVLTTIANILVMLVLTRKSQRNATNVFLIAVAVSDSLTGLSTLPTYLYAFTHYEKNDLKLTEVWCEAFNISKLFVSKSFHTMSVWFTVCLVSQRFISVSWPFKAQTIFTIPKTLIMITTVAVLSPVLHVFHLQDKKSVHFRCAWELKAPCVDDCAYLWMTFLFMHFIPCTLVVVLTSMMIYVMNQTEDRLQESHLITNQKILKRRAAQNRRISIIIVIVAIIFLIPEIPYGIFLLISVSLKHTGKELMSLDKNRAFHCAYEILLVLSFHANFWVYTIMNRKFRSGLKRTFIPCLNMMFRCLRICGVQKYIARKPSMSSSTEMKMEQERATRTTTTLSMSGHSQSVRSNQSDLEMKMYRDNSLRQPVHQVIEEYPSQEVEKEVKNSFSGDINKLEGCTVEKSPNHVSNLEIKTYNFSNSTHPVNQTEEEG